MLLTKDNSKPNSNNNNNSNRRQLSLMKTTTIGITNNIGKTRQRQRTQVKMLNWQFVVLGVLLVLVSDLVTVNGLKCYMCGQYNEGVGSITPCLNYSDKFAPAYLKECSKKTEKFCVKYVSELSTVRDCATECVEKEIWETQTYCCNEEGCNGSSSVGISQILVLMTLAFTFIKVIIANIAIR